MYNTPKTKLRSVALIITFCAFLPCLVFSQTNWQDSFADSNFTQNPLWEGDTADFTANSQALRLMAPSVTSKKLVYTTSEAIWEAEWEFTLRYDFNPSSSNYAKVFFASSLDLQNSYWVEVGGNTQDRIRLRKTESGQSSILLQSTDDWLDNSTVDIRIKITRDPLGGFTLYADTSGSYTTIGSVIDTSLFTSEVFAWECNYTSTRSDKFFLDDISVSGKVYQDSILPSVLNAGFADSLTLLLEFNEPVDSVSTTSLTNYVLAPGGSSPTSVHIKNSKSVELKFVDGFVNRTSYSLWIENVEDLFGNAIEDTTLQLFYYAPVWGDVVLSEIMFDPTPPVQLPDFEYVELYNNSGLPLNLKDWSLGLGNKTVLLPEYTVNPNAYVLISDSSAVSQLSLSNSIGVDWPSGFLVNSGGRLRVLGPQMQTVFYSDYSTGLYSNPNKAQGGWSLENRDVTSECLSPAFWDGSENANGGTPGSPNSLSKPTRLSAPFVKHIIYHSSQKIQLVFSEEVDSLFLFSDLPLVQNQWQKVYDTHVFVAFNSPMQELTLHSVSVHFVSGCFGENSTTQTLSFGLPKLPEHGDLKINEILFNPTENGSDFIEVYNTSKECLLLNSLRLAQVNPLDGFPDNVEVLSLDSILLPPNQYWVFANNRSALLSEHQLNDTALVFESSLPTMPNTEGSIGVCNASLEWIDKLEYNAGWHHPLISDDEGVSLERVDLNSPTQESTNWHSATFSSGYATPTKTNSQAGRFNPAGSVSFSTELLTPNNDGLDDVLQIVFALDKPGWVGTIEVFDVYGRPQLNLLSNKPIGTNESILWHGINKNGTRIKRGGYIIFIELWHPNGERLIEKKPLTIYYED